MCNAHLCNTHRGATHGCIVGVSLPMECIISPDRELFIEVAAMCPHALDDDPHSHFVAHHGSHDRIRQVLVDQFAGGVHDGVSIYFEGINFFSMAKKPGDTHTCHPFCCGYTGADTRA